MTVVKNLTSNVPTKMKISYSTYHLGFLLRRFVKNPVLFFDINVETSEEEKNTRHHASQRPASQCWSLETNGKEENESLLKL